MLADEFVEQSSRAGDVAVAGIEPGEVEVRHIGGVRSAVPSLQIFELFLSCGVLLRLGFELRAGRRLLLLAGGRKQRRIDGLDGRRKHTLGEMFTGVAKVKKSVRDDRQ